jgi:NADH-quinone oxidoreductase subunit L/multicomponent Na+:H+ antiporter subunit D
MTAFAVAAAGLIGFPLVAGFVSKFHLLVGAAESASPLFVGAFLVAGLLKLLYFWPIVYVAFFADPGDETPAGRHAFAPPHGATDGGVTEHAPVGGGTDAGAVGRVASGVQTPAFAPTTHRWGLEASPFVLGPVLFTVGMAILLGLVPTAVPFWELAETAVTEVFG